MLTLGILLGCCLLSDGQSPEYSLRVALDEEYRAKGSVYCDDGVSAGENQCMVLKLALNEYIAE